MFRLHMQLFADLTFRALVGVHLRTYMALHGYFSLFILFIYLFISFFYLFINFILIWGKS